MLPRRVVSALHRAVRYDLNMKNPQRACVSVWVALALFLVGCSGAAKLTPTDRSPSGVPPTDEAASEATLDLSTLRSVLRGEPLTDAQILFLHAALQRSGTEYTKNGLLTFAEWELAAEVRLKSDKRWSLRVAGPSVNAEWQLLVDPETGEVEEGYVSTYLPIPDPQ